MLLGIVFALLSALTVSVGNVLLAKSVRDFPPSVTFALETTFGLVLWIPFALLVGVEFDKLLLSAPIVLISAILAEAYPFYIFKKGHATLVRTAFSTYGLFTILFSWLINGEVLNTAQYLAAIAIITGIVIIVFDFQEKRFKASYLVPILWGLSAAITAGVSDTISKGVINETSAATFLFLLAPMQIPVALGYLKAEKQRLNVWADVRADFGRYKHALWSAALLATSMIFFWLAFEHTLASIASPITASNAAFVAILSYFFLGERFAKKDYLGIGLTIIGIIAISVV